MAEGRSTTWRIGGRFGEGEGTEKADGRVKKRKDVSPSNVGSGIGVGARIEEDTGTEFDDIIRRDSKAVPKKPPATGRIWKRSWFLYTSDAADDILCVDLGGRRIIKKKIRETNLFSLRSYTSLRLSLHSATLTHFL